MTTVRAIETRYAGCLFRSRLEARWAVFFDALGVTWEYEPQGYVCGTRRPRRYLPDFRLNGETWAEVKGEDAAVDWDFLADACDGRSSLPGIPDSEDTSRGLLLLGPVPAGGLTHPWRHIGVQHASLPPQVPDPPGLRGLVYARYFAFSDRGFVMPVEYPLSPGVTCGCTPGSVWHWNRHRDGTPGYPPTIEGAPYKNPHLFSSRIADAYAAARSARFEFGQSGAGR